jgi:hypothetical protein
MLKMLGFGIHCSQEEVAQYVGLVVRAQVESSIQCYPMATIPSSLFTLNLMNAMYAKLLEQLQNMMRVYTLHEGP